MLAMTQKPPPPPADQALLDTTAYGLGPDDNVTNTTEAAAVTQHHMELGGHRLDYTATAGHLVTIDPSSSQPNARFFYVAFTANNTGPTQRPVTFFYNGGPGASSVFLLLGSFAPRRIKTSLPGFTPPAPYAMEDNPDSLLDKTDLVFINPVGTGYSAAIAPFKNRDFWGVDEDANSLKQFIKRYLSANNRWNSPKFLFGESYGTPRSCVLAWALHEDGIDLNGVVLQSSILDYAQSGNPVNLLPTLAADAWYHQKTSVVPPPVDLPAFMQDVVAFAQTGYAAALNNFPKLDEAALKTLSEVTGISPTVLTSWGLDVAVYNNAGTLLFLLTLLQSQGRALGAYDGRVTGIDTGIAGAISPNSGGNDPTMAAVSGVYTVMWNSYLANDLKFTSLASFADLNDQTFQHWNFSHIDPTGAQKGKDANGNIVLYPAGDLAAVMAVNPDLKVFAANGYFDAVTPFQQTITDLANMPLADAGVRSNLSIRSYPSGHMIYLDGPSRTAMKADLAPFYDSAVHRFAAVAQLRMAQSRVRHFHTLRARTASGALATGAWQVPDLCQAYQWPSAAAGGGVIAIVALGGGWQPSDMEAYFSGIGLPQPVITDVSVDGSGNQPGVQGPVDGADVEVTLDIQIAAASYAAATGKAANIRVYWAAPELISIAAAVRAATADHCDVCSISWGADEAVWKAMGRGTGHHYLQEMEAAVQAATSTGMVVFAAAGDSDSSDGGPAPAGVTAPASCPHSIACGGTHKTASSETVWNNNPGNPYGAGTGGGYSKSFAPQSWQAGAPVGPGRMVPDVAAVADPRTGYLIHVQGKAEIIGGTSAVAPLYAGLFAGFGRKLGFVAPTLWAHQVCFNDITQGDNGFYRARIGPDPCTGLGTPIGNRLSALFGGLG